MFFDRKIKLLLYTDIVYQYPCCFEMQQGKYFNKKSGDILDTKVYKDILNENVKFILKKSELERKKLMDKAKFLLGTDFFGTVS